MFHLERFGWGLGDTFGDDVISQIKLFMVLEDGSNLVLRGDKDDITFLG